MSKFRVSEGRKTKPVPISLRPKHIAMLDDLEKQLRKNRSALIQDLIEAAYEKHIGECLVERGEDE